MQWLIVFVCVCESMCRHDTVSKAMWVHFAATSTAASIAALLLMHVSLYGRALLEPSGLVC